MGIVARISAEAVARLRNPASEPEAVVVRGEDGESGVDDQWASLRE